MASIVSLCVYCGSSSLVAKSHLALARALGRRCAERGIAVVFGGGRVGLMGALADGALAAGGAAIGVIPQHLMHEERGHQGLTRLDVVTSMHERKQRMFELSDAFCALPGGLGTLDETFEMITWRQLGLHDRPIVLLDHEGFWQPLLALIEHQAQAGYLKPADGRLFVVADSIDTLFLRLAEAPEPRSATDTRRL